MKSRKLVMSVFGAVLLTGVYVWQVNLALAAGIKLAEVSASFGEYAMFMMFSLGIYTGGNVMSKYANKNGNGGKA